MIYVVQNNIIDHPLVTNVTPSEGMEIYEVIRSEKYVGYDIETNDLDSFLADVLLVCCGNEKDQLVWNVVDHDCPKWDFSDNVIVGQNLKFDICFSIVNILKDINVLNCKYWDTLIASHKVRQGLPIKHALDHLLKTYLDVDITKDIREQFIGVPPHAYKGPVDHIIYSANDVKHLIPLMRKLEEEADVFEILPFLERTEFPKIKELAYKECIGFKFNSLQWSETLKTNIEEHNALEAQLMGELQNIIAYARKHKTKYAAIFSHEKYKRNPQNFKLEQQDLFGSISKYTYRTKKFGSANTLKTKKSKINLNFGSSSQILIIFAGAGLPAPTSDGDYGVPYPDHKSNQGLGFTLRADKLEQLIIEYPKHPMKKFIKLYIKYSSLSTLISGFGEKFLQKINPVSGRIHSLYRQTGSMTGRLRSGGGKRQPNRYNSQNIPRDERYRKAFTCEDDYMLMTLDWRAAEVVIMASMTGSKALLNELLQGDVHSKIATAGWRLIHKYRTGLELGLWSDYKDFEKNRNIKGIVDQADDPLITRYYNLSQNFTVSPTENKEFRPPIKNFIYGSFYGMNFYKGAETLNISPDESKIVLNLIRSTFPKVFQAFEKNLDTAIKQGYLVYNNRSKSRMWFSEILEYQDDCKYMLETYGHLPNDYYKSLGSLRSRSKGNAFNNPIQGTQADALKEASVDQMNFFISHNLFPQKAVCISEVHDEFVNRLHKSLIPIELGGWAKEPTFEYEEKKVYLHEWVHKNFCEVANRYLDTEAGFVMEASYAILPHWTK